MIPTLKSEHLTLLGNPTLTNLDETERAPLQTIIARGQTYAVTFGVYLCADNPPEYDPVTQRIVRNPIDQWKFTKTNPAVTYTVINIPFDELRDAALDRINGEYQMRTAVLAADYPEDEQKSWPVQIAEAAIVLGADDQPTPWIDNAAVARGIARETLAALITAQDTAYRAYHGQLTGIRQALRDQVYAVPDDEHAAAAFAAIVWPETETEPETT
ncbi:hypothetical protein H0A73_17530 [Alcaligenaceae bacterium]|nr:hypothetical protein [Alcaligenaceae bacterium]